MTWKIYDHTYENDSDFTAGIPTNEVCGQPVRFKTNYNLQRTRAWISFRNDPSYSALTMKCYYWDNATNTRGDLYASSTTTWTEATLRAAAGVTEDHYIIETYFVWNDIPFDTVNWFEFVISGTSSGLDSDTRIAWKSTYPSPPYTDNVTISFSNLPRFPMELSFAGERI
jgi:hypothetical protein